MTTEQMTKCDWCGTEGIRVRMRYLGENACEYCAAYMQAAAQHPEYEQQNRRLAAYRAEWRRAQYD